MPNSIARFVMHLRKALGHYSSRIETTSSGYRVIVEPGELDLDGVSIALAAASADRGDADGQPARASDDLGMLTSSIGLRSNPHLDDLRGLEAVSRSHFEIRIALHEAFADVLYRQERYLELIALLERIVDGFAFHERFWQLLVMSLDAVGRERDALEACNRLRRVLGSPRVLPSEPLLLIEVDLRRRLDDRETSSSSVLLVDSADSGIVDERTQSRAPLIGRVNEVRDVHRLVGQHRLVTIVGLGGTGKTRLALAVGDAFTDTTPVHQLNLGSVTDPEVVVQLAASVLGVPPADLDAVALAQTVARQRLVFILDNCEHLLDVCGHLVVALVEHAPHVRVLATSRLALELPDEVSYLLAPLDTASADLSEPSDAAQLFIDRARLRLATPKDPKTLERIERVCRLLNGLPLSVEIAAAQLAFMNLAELDERTTNAFRAVDGVAEPAVHVTRDVLDWAWDRLSPSQQALLARLSVFASGWTERSAIAVHAGPGSIRADLDRLVAASLVTAAAVPKARTAIGVADGDAVRYSMLPVVREYSAERLDDRGEARIMNDRLASWALDLTATYSFTEHQLWCEPNDELYPEHGNLIAALTHLHQEGRTEDLVTLAVASSGMMVNRGLAGDLVRWLSPLIDDETLDWATRGAACVALGTAVHALGDLESITLVGTQGLMLADGAPLDWVPVLAGYMSVWSLVAPMEIPTDELSAMAFTTAEASVSRDLNTGVASLYRGHVEFVKRNYEQAVEQFRRARDLVERPGRGLLVIEIGETLSLFMLGRHDEALASIDAWRSRSETDHWHYILDVIRAIVVGGTGGAEQATADLTAAVRALPEAGAWGRAGIVQTAFAMLADFRGEPELATELFASAVNRDIMLLSVAIAHVMGVRGLSGDEAWLTVGIEFWTRIVPADSVAATAASAPQLLQWWSSGVVTEP